MKKYMIIAIAALVAYPTVYGLTDTEIIAQLDMASNYAETALKDSSTKVTVQDEVLNKWVRVFNDAKNFATENSKTAGVKDSTLMNALNNIDKFNTSVIDTIKYSRTASVQNLTNKKKLIAPMQGYVTLTINDLNAKRFTLHHKIRAQKVIVAMGKGLHKIILAAVQYISSRENGMAQAPARPLPNTPNSAGFVVTPEMKQFFMQEISNNHERTFMQSVTLRQAVSLKNILENVVMKFKDRFRAQLQSVAYNQMGVPLYNGFSDAIQTYFGYDADAMNFVKDNLSLAILKLKN